MSRAAPFLFLFFAVIAQSTLPHYFGLSGAAVNAAFLVLLVSVFFGGHYKKTMFAALAAGFLLDGLSGLPFGAVAVSFLVSVFLAYWILSFISQHSFFHFVFFVVLSAALYRAVLFGALYLANILGLYGHIFIFSSSAVLGLGVEALVGMTIAGAVLFPLRKRIII